MVVLNKVTQLYVPHEDRICMTAEAHDGRSVVYWLTQRICRQLVPLLCGHVDRITPDKRVVSRDMQLTCMQRQAEWRFQPSEPVQVPDGTTMVLPLKIDYAFTGDVATLSFPVVGDDRADLSLTAQELRQWLAIMYRLFSQAGWPTDVWPSWFTAAGEGRN